MKKYWIMMICAILLVLGIVAFYILRPLLLTAPADAMPAPQETETESETVKTIEVEESIEETMPETAEPVVVHHDPVWDTTGIENQPYLVAVNRCANTITVYAKDAEGNYTVPEKAMLCSTASEADNTPLGTYTTTDRYEWCRMVDDSWGRYAIRIHDLIMFHSVCYKAQTSDSLDYEAYNKLGDYASLGCIRLAIGDELWLYENCPRGFTVVIYDDAEDPGPLGKPEPVRINPLDTQKRGWDPTDPDPQNPWH